ncbi:MAG: hypothetical protein JXA15_14040 [Spirochaetales bacterium]|nr:hypothetical protein [Spirochaetales bacterium]
MDRTRTRAILSVLVLVALAGGSAAAQPFAISDLFSTGVWGIPEAELREPFPWGVEPTLDEVRDLPPGAAWLRIVETVESEREKPASRVILYVAGAEPGAWTEGGEPRNWLEGDTSYYLRRDFKGARVLVACTGPWDEPLAVRRFSESGLSSEAWVRDAEDPSIWRYRSDAGASLVWERHQDGAETVWISTTDDGAIGPSFFVDRLAGRVETVGLEDASRPHPARARLEWDDEGSRIGGFSADGFDFRFDFDAKGNPVARRFETAGASIRQSFALDGNGFVVSGTFESPVSTQKARYFYDARGWPVRMETIVLGSPSASTPAYRVTCEREVGFDAPPGGRKPVVADASIRDLLAGADALVARIRDDAAERAGQAGGFRGGLVTDPGGIDDGSIN